MRIYTGYEQYRRDMDKARVLDAKIRTTKAKLRTLPPQAKIAQMALLKELIGQRKLLPGLKERIRFRVSRAPAFYMNSPVHTQSTWQKDIDFSPSTNMATILGRIRPCSTQRLRAFLTNRSLGQYFNRNFKGK